MIVVKDKKALLFKLKDPTRITTVIPGAKRVDMKGHQMVAVHHRPDEVTVLRNLGYEGIPDPMPMHYPFAAQFKAAQAQITSASFLSLNRRAFCLNSMGLGKTVTALWCADYLKRCGLVHKVLVVAPLSTLERAWGDEIFRTFPELSFNVLHGTRDRRLKLLANPADVYIINPAGVGIIKAELAKRGDIDLVIVDESALYRNATTKQWKDMNDVLNKQLDGSRRAWGLTGAPIPNSPLDAWAQCRLIVPNSPDVPKAMTRFKEATMKQVSQYVWAPKPDALDIVHRAMQPAIRFTLDETFDLPEQIFVEREVEMSPEQKKAYKEMHSKLLAEHAGGQITAVNAAVKVNKLVQIACGAAYQVDGSVLAFPSKERIDVLRELIEESDGKVLVFVPLTGVIDHLVEELKDLGVACVDGRTSKTQRDEIFANFQDTASPRVIVAHPATMSHGLTLTKATTIVWYAPITSHDLYVQACARVRRPGQTKTTVIVHVHASPVERKLYDRLAGKAQIQDALLDMVRDSEGVTA